MPPARARRTTLLCLSHLRWEFVYQRPQHLLSRAAKTFDVYFFEEPIFEATGSPRVVVTRHPSNVTVVVPVLPGLHPARMDKCAAPIA